MVHVGGELKESAHIWLVVPVEIVQAEQEATEDDEENAHELEDVGDHATEYNLKRA